MLFDNDSCSFQIFEILSKYKSLAAKSVSVWHKKMSYFAFDKELKGKMQCPERELNHRPSGNGWLLYTIKLLVFICGLQRVKSNCIQVPHAATLFKIPKTPFPNHKVLKTHRFHVITNYKSLQCAQCVPFFLLYFLKMLFLWCKTKKKKLQTRSLPPCQLLTLLCFCLVARIITGFCKKKKKKTISKPAILN